MLLLRHEKQNPVRVMYHLPLDQSMLHFCRKGINIIHNHEEQKREDNNNNFNI